MAVDGRHSRLPARSGGDHGSESPSRKGRSGRRSYAHGGVSCLGDPGQRLDECAEVKGRGEVEWVHSLVRARLHLH